MANSFRDKVVKDLATKYNGVVEIIEDVENIGMLIKDHSQMVKIFEELRDNYKLKLLVNLTAIDWKEEFEVVYTIVSVESTDRLNVRVKIPRDKSEVPSITPVYNAANVQEREAYDLMGIIFKGHPNLTRILLADDFEGHPLRKDFVLKE